MSSIRHTEARPHCYRCDKPLTMCVCASLEPIANVVGVHILQHPRERRHPLGTTRLLRLGLASVHVHVLGRYGRGVACAPVPLPEGAGLLYPSPSARDLTTLAEEERPAHLVVIDGTWPHANRIYRDNPWIAALPHYDLAPTEASRYRIRAEPRPECLSTVESVVAALRVLQPDLEGTETLLAALDVMIDAQIAASARPSTHARGKRSRNKRAQHIPAAMRAPGAHVVVVYAEAAPAREEGSGPRLPIRLSAISLDGARVFDRTLESETALVAVATGRLGFELHEFEPPQPYDEVVTAFRAFCAGPEGAPAVLVSWGGWTHRWLTDTMDAHPCIALKTVWSNISHARVPALPVLLDDLGLAAPDPPVIGRGGLRLSQAHAMAQHILQSDHAT